MKQQQCQTVMLADNFPAKAYLLVTHLTENDPKVASFSPDGNAFEIYDQSTFASKYLPQYFKHSNYGSFVRQLNLYGFTSSRLKQDNDVVVWTHEYFHRDRKDLVKEIKRTKKNKSTKPSHVHISNTRSPSPPSMSEEWSSDNTHPAKISRKVSGLDQEWLQSEFAFLKKQNQSLEQKLDMLLKITLRISPNGIEDAHAGEKRRRMSPVESSNPARYELGSIHEEQKFFDGDTCEIRHEQPFEESKYGGDGKMPHAGGTRDYSFGARDESLKRFVDIMLNEDEEPEECKTMDERSEGETPSPVSPTTPNNVNGRRGVYEATYPPGNADQNALDDQLMEEAMNAVLPGGDIDTDGDLFALSEDAGEYVDAADMVEAHSSPPTYASIERAPGPVRMANAAVDKADGPQPIQTISAGPLATEGRDIEEGNMPLGVTVVAAEAQLVEDDGQLQLHELDRQHERKHRKRVLCLLAFIGIAVVIGVTWPAVVVTKNKKYKAASRPPPRPPCEGGGGGGGKGGGCGGKGGGWIEDSHDGGWTSFDEPGRWKSNPDDELLDGEEATANDETLDDIVVGEDDQASDGPFDGAANSSEIKIVRTITGRRHYAMKKKISSIFDEVGDPDDDPDDDEDEDVPPFSLSIAGTNFVCSPGGPS